ncbi:MAG: hypothetical protein R2789_14125 [Microthrixaceae bacterium]
MNLGQILNDAFPGGPEVPDSPSSPSALSAISYYSDLESVDMLGLTDEWVKAERGRGANLLPRPRADGPTRVPRRSGS